MYAIFANNPCNSFEIILWNQSLDCQAAVRRENMIKQVKEDQQKYR